MSGVPAQCRHALKLQLSLLRGVSWASFTMFRLGFTPGVLSGCASRVSWGAPQRALIGGSFTYRL